MTVGKIENLFKHIECNVAFDNLTRRLYSTDASIYEILPAGVAFPRNKEEASGLVRTAHENSIPIIARGAGSGLAGGALGEGIVVDFSKHFKDVSELNIEKRSVYVEAGVVLDTLNAFLKRHGFCFGPDVATSSRATIGGMIANDSSGARASYYGTTADHVLAVDVVLSDGRIVRLKPNTDIEEIDSVKEEILNHTHTIKEFYSLKNYPYWKHDNANKQRIYKNPFNYLVKRFPGYDIGRFLLYPEDASSIIPGSEGTLALILGAELRIVPLPSKKGLCILFFNSVKDALESVTEIFDLEPVAIENVDRILFDQTRGQPKFKAARSLLELDDKPCEAFLIVEFYNDNVEEKLNILKNRKLGSRSLCLTDEVSMNRVWSLRKAGLSLLTGCKGPAKPTTGIEDIAVPPVQMPKFFNMLDNLLKSHGLDVCYYGHAGAGLLHIRPVLDLRKNEDRIKFRKVADAVASIVCEFRGSLAGEHGVGIARTEYMESQVNREILELMQKIKMTFDPKNILNPGKIIGNGIYKIDTNLRYDRGYEIKLPFAPKLRFGTRDESFIANLEQCNGCGNCRKETPTMCPTFLATGDESMSTRGRANIIRSVFDVRNLTSEIQVGSRELFNVVGNCLACKACATECPSNVNMALLKAELLNAKNEMEGVPIQAQIFGNVDLIGRLGTWFPKISNAIIKSNFVKTILLKFAGITDKRDLPEFAEICFRKMMKMRRENKSFPRGNVILWDDTYVNYFEPQIGISAVDVLEYLGYQVLVLKDRKCCGRPAFSQGLLKKAEALGKYNLNLLNKREGCVEFITSGGEIISLSAEESSKLPIIFLEPSCYSMFADDYFELKLEGTEAVSARCCLFEEFLESAIPNIKPELKLTDMNIAVHAHCHVKYRKNTEFMKKVLSFTTNRGVKVLETGCCGMAGAFGATASKYELSRKVGMLMANVINNEPDDTVIVASGTSCRQQIKHLTNRAPLHSAELFSKVIGNS